MVQEEVESASADKDPEIMSTVQALIDAVKNTPEGQNVISKYNLNIRGSDVGVIGDYASIDEIHLHCGNGDWENFYLKRLIARCDPMDLAVMEETYQPTGPNGEQPMIRVSDIFTTRFLVTIHATRSAATSW